MTRLRYIFSTLLSAVVVLAPGCKSGDAPAAAGGRGRGPMAYPVEVRPVDTRPVVYTITAVGSVEAFEIVQVTARVAGVVERVRFSEGTRAAAGQTLVEIEPERYRLAVTAATAALDKARSARADAEAGLQRREQASTRNPGIIPGEEIETWRTRVQAAAADVAQAEAALAQAELNLRDAFARAPVAGVTQTRSVQTGQYVQPGTVLATLVRRDPLLLRFTVTEQDASRIQAGFPARFSVRGDSTLYDARITLVAASADERSRMVAVTAEVTDRRRELLRPGSFAEVRIPVGELRPMPVVPLTAIRASERGFLAYVVEGTVARERVLTLGLRTSDGMVEVLSGISAGERLVIRGGEALREGAAVREGRTRDSGDARTMGGSAPQSDAAGRGASRPPGSETSR